VTPTCRVLASLLLFIDCCPDIFEIKIIVTKRERKRRRLAGTYTLKKPWMFQGTFRECIPNKNNTKSIQNICLIV